MLVQLKEGWAYVSGFAPVRTILLLFAIVSLMGWPFTVLMPIFAGNILKGGPHTLGFLMGAVGIGALISAISLALRKTVLGLGKMLPIATAAFGAGLILVRNVESSMAIAAADAGLRFWDDATDGGQQHHYPDDRGR